MKTTLEPCVQPHTKKGCAVFQRAVMAVLITITLPVLASQPEQRAALAGRGGLDVIDVDLCSRNARCAAYGAALEHNLREIGVSESFELEAVSPQEFDELVQILSERDHHVEASALADGLKELTREESELMASESPEAVRAVAMRRALFTRDLEIKLQQDRGRQRWAIEVKAIDPAGQEVAELWIRYVPTFWLGHEDRVREFPDRSSPTTHRLVRGTYFMWTATSLEGGSTGARRLVEVRQDGHTQLPSP